jgi:hypothetical protein
VSLPRDVDYYEFAAILVPGAALVLGASTALSLPLPAIASDITIGGFGVVVLASFVCGHLVQAVGNVLEAAWWKAAGGWPTDKVRAGKAHLPAAQVAGIEARLSVVLKLDGVHVRDLSRAEWRAIVQQIRAALGPGDAVKRLEIFNANYGLFRGLASALLVVAAILVATDVHRWPLACLFVSAAGVALLRMHRFAGHYGRELFAQFLQVPDGGKSQAPPPTPAP